MYRSSRDERAARFEKRFEKQTVAAPFEVHLHFSLADFETPERSIP
jgi:hypothetical protein